MLLQTLAWRGNKGEERREATLGSIKAPLQYLWKGWCQLERFGFGQIAQKKRLMGRVENEKND